MRVQSVIFCSLAGLFLIAQPATLSAQKKSSGGGSHGSDISLGVRFGTLGVGGEVAKLVNSHIGLRVGANFLTYNTTKDESDVTFDAHLKMKGISGLIDLFPGARGSFHLTGGVMSNPVDITATGVPNANGHFTINNVDYTAAQVGTFSGEGKWPSASPYAGIGWGTPAAHKGALKLVFDLGAVIGKPTINLSASNPDAGLQANVAAQQAKTQKDIEKYAKVYPVISFGLVYRF